VLTAADLQQLKDHGIGEAEARRQLAIITLGLMGREASGALAALREMATHPAMGAAATQAIDRIER
jgi:hypothetical protein